MRTLATRLPSSGPLRNTLWNLLGGAWVGFVTLVATPWYVSLLGLDGYGILSLWLVLQVMMGVFDLGLGATLNRQFARQGLNKSEAQTQSDLLRTLEMLYWTLALLIAGIMFGMSGWVTVSWLKVGLLDPTEIQNAIKVMAIALGLQFPSVLYSQGLAGLHAQGKMNLLQVLGHSARYGLGVIALLWRADLVWFFTVQTIVAILQTLATRTAVWAVLRSFGPTTPRFRLNLLRESWRFSTGMALTSISALLLANVDRIALSRMVPTAELGKYGIAFTATGLIQLGIQPFYRAFFPRYAQLIASGDKNAPRDEYFRSCRLAALIIIPCAVVAGLFAPYLFDIWIGRRDETIVSAFRWLLVGIATSGLMWLPAAFQQAHGWTRLHATMILGALILGFPVMVLAIKSYGLAGAASLWVLHGISDITLGLWLMHRRLLKGQLSDWYRSVLLPPLSTSVPLACLSLFLLPHDVDRLTILCWIVATVASLIVIALFTLSWRVFIKSPNEGP